MTSKQQTPEPLGVDAKTAAKLVGVGRTAFLAGVSAKRIPAPTKIGRRAVWSLDLLRDWLAAGGPPVGKFKAMRAHHP